MHRRLISGLLSLSLIVFSLNSSISQRALAQDAKEGKQKQRVSDENTIRLGNVLITLNVSVLGKEEKETTNLTRENFELLEDDRRQEIAFFAQEDQPISFGLLIDRSQSMGDTGKLQNAMRAALSFLRAGNPQNEAFCMMFNESTELLFDFTSDFGKIESALSNLDADGGTALYDAIIKGLEKLKQGKHRRRALIIITDGADQHSRHSLTELIVQAQQSQAQIYGIGFFSPDEAQAYKASGSKITLINGKEIDNPRFVFQSLADESGAAVFFPRSEQELNEVASNIARSLRRQYLLAYYPSDQSDDERYRNIKMNLRGANTSGLKIKTRKGYRMRGHNDDAEEETVAKDRAPSARERAVASLRVETSVGLSDEPGPDQYQESFADSSSGWPNTEDSFYERSKYHLRGNRIVTAKNYVYSDFEASVNVELLPRSKMSGLQRLDTINVAELPAAGLYFRMNPGSTYVFLIAPAPDGKEGYYKLAKVVAGRQIDLVSWKKDTAIRMRNHLTVRCQGSQIELYANHIRLAVVKDAANLQGRVAIAVMGGQATFDDLLLKKIKY